MPRFTTLTTLFLISLFSYGSTQSLTGQLGDISSNCQQAALTLLGSDFATCSNLQGLLGVATSSSGSLIEPINTWLEGLCTRGNCSSSAIQNATSVIDNGCSSDLNSGNEIITGIRSLVENFNEEKAGVCLQQTSNNTYCLTSLLTSVQQATGNDLSISSLTDFTNLTALTSIPSSTLCTPCNSALVYSLSQASSLNQSDVQAAQSYCSDSSFGTSIPQGISSEATTSTSNGTTGTDSNSSSGGTNSASGLNVGNSLKIAGSALVGVFGLVLLA